MTTSTPPVVSIIGWHNTSKTTVATALVRLLRARGLRVAAVKHSREDIELDHPGTDTSLLAEAGAEVVVIASRRRLAWLERPPAEVSLSEIIARLPEGIDLVITEGFKTADTPKIEVVRPGWGEGRISAPGRLLAVVCDDAAVEDRAPVFGRHAMSALADHLLAELGLSETD